MSGMRHVLAIGGSDSSSGAGIQADLKTLAAFGVYGTTAITAITAQNTIGVTALMALSADLVTAQVEAVAGDIELHAIKIGMLGTAAIVEVVAAAIESLELPTVVLDPVMVSSSGERLLDSDGVQALSMGLLPRARVVTPNIPEAEVLSGIRIVSADDRRRAARRIHELGAAGVIITGGHALSSENDVVDLLFDGTAFLELQTPRVQSHPGQTTHGTGCAFASAVAARLALGDPLADAAARAQQYVAGAIAHALAIGQGARAIDHFWQTRSPRNLVI